MLIAAKLAALALAAATGTAPFSLTVSPTHVTARPGQVRIIKITDSGSRPVTVAASLATVSRVQGACRITNRAPAGVAIHPATLHLRPGQTRAARVRITRRAEAGALAVEFTSLRSGAGTVRVRAGVASQLVVRAQAKPGQHPCQAVSSAVTPATPSGGGYRPLLALGSILALLLAGLGTLALVLRRRHERARLGRVAS